MPIPFSLFLLAAAGFSAGFINTPAGGGSMLTTGVLMIMGIDPITASGTSRLGVLLGTASAVNSYKKNNLLNIKGSLSKGIFTLPGAIIGAFYSTKLSNILFQRILIITMIFVLIALILPRKKENHEPEIKQVKEKMIYPAMFIIGFYGGFIQIGVGFVMMLTLQYLASIDLVTITREKMFIVFLYTIPVTILFAITGKIDWVSGLILSAGSWAGAKMAVKLAIKKGNRLIKTVLAISVILMIIKLGLSFF